MIDGAINSTFEIYEISDEQFQKLFPSGTNIAFAADFPESDPVWSGLYSNRVPKPRVQGIHGTLHLRDKEEKGQFFPTRREEEVQ